jgi:hypothetical protein
MLHNTSSTSEYLLRGFTEACPEQGGIPGWRRICFVIFRTEHNPPPIHEHDDECGDNCNAGEQHWQPDSWDMGFHWAKGYQGIITPGGKIMVGGWSDVLHGADGSCGPFIFWEVEGLEHKE